MQSCVVSFPLRSGRACLGRSRIHPHRTAVQDGGMREQPLSHSASARFQCKEAAGAYACEHLRALMQAVHAQVLRKLRRLAWATEEGYVVRTMIAAAKGRFTDLPLVASLAAGLARYHPSLGIALPDALLEEARACADPGLCHYCLCLFAFAFLPVPFVPLPVAFIMSPNSTGQHSDFAAACQPFHLTSCSWQAPCSCSLLLSPLSERGGRRARLSKESLLFMSGLVRG